MENSEDRTPDIASESFGSGLILPVLAGLLTAYYFVSTSELVWEAKATGLIVAGVLIVLCGLQVMRVVMSMAAGRGRFGFGGLFDDTPFDRQRLALLVLAVLFVVTLGWLGTTLGLFLLLIGGMLVLGVRQVHTLFAVAFTTAAVVDVLLIRLLNSRLPRGIVEDLLAAVLKG
ncbi:MAG: hypothetical protein ACREC6_15410 [Hyphomicrobiaceae bacterium]